MATRPAARSPSRPATRSSRSTSTETQRWRRTAGVVETDWVAEMKGKGIDGAKLAAEARALIAKYSQVTEAARTCRRPAGPTQVPRRGGSPYRWSIDAAIAPGQWLALLAGVLLTAIAADVVRQPHRPRRSSGIGRPVPGDFELVQMATAVAVLLFLPWCHLRHGHIMVDFFTRTCLARRNAGSTACGDVLMLGVVLLILTWRLRVGGISASSPARETTMMLGFPRWIVLGRRWAAPSC